MNVSTAIQTRRAEKICAPALGWQSQKPFPPTGKLPLAEVFVEN